MNNTWKKSIAAAVLGIAILTQAPAVNAQAQGMYKANDDDSFWKLSNAFGVTVSQLMQANPFVDAGNIYDGLQLVIPAAEKASALKSENGDEPSIMEIQAKPAAAKEKAHDKAHAKPAAVATMAQAVKAVKKTATAKAAVKKATPKAQTKAPAAKAVPVKKASSARKVSTAKKATAVKPKQDHVTVNGKSYVYTDVVQAKASAYTDAASENGWGPVDYFGNPLKLGTIAVDPDVIPMGSKVYITGYDYNGLPSGGMIAVASDQGSAINGNRIDIFVPQSQQAASNFGFQNVKVFILH